MTVACDISAQEANITQEIDRLMQGKHDLDPRLDRIEIREINALIRERSKTLAMLEENPTLDPVNLLIKIISINCRSVNDDFLGGSTDEPYLLIHVVHRFGLSPGGSPVRLPDQRTFLLGPFEGVSAGTTVPINGVIYGDAGQPAVSSREDMFIFAALLEHDSSSPETILSAADTAVKASMALSLAQGPAELRRTLLNAFAGAIPPAIIISGGLGVVNDDLFGPAQDLKISNRDLRAIACQSRPVTWNTFFFGDPGLYLATFELARL